MKSVSELIDTIKSNLKTLGSPLANFTNYSNIYFFVRSIASAISQQYTELDNYFLNSFLNTATGNNLDLRASDYNLVRVPGSPAKGFIYATSTNPTIIPQGTILITATNSFQYQTTEEATVNSLGVYIPISSIINSEAANINAGLILTSSFYPLVKFTIGSFKDINGEFTGGLQGGLSLESDEEFRLRIRSQLSNLTRGTLESVIAKLNELALSKFFIKESYPVTGYFTIYVDTQDRSVIDSIEEQVMLTKPLGTAFEIQTISNQFVDLRFNVTLSSLDLAESVSNSIRQICFNYFNTLELGQELYPVNLSVLCSSINGIIDIRVTDPSESKVIVPKDSLLKLRNINLTILGG